MHSDSRVYLLSPDFLHMERRAAEGELTWRGKSSLSTMSGTTRKRSKSFQNVLAAAARATIPKTLRNRDSKESHLLLANWQAPKTIARP